MISEDNFMGIKIIFFTLKEPLYFSFNVKENSIRKFGPYE